MAIQDRNLSVGTKLYARYKGATHTAEVVEKEGKPVYRLPDGKEFKSPSAAGSAVMGGNACNGWAFWSVGDGGETTGPVRSTRSTVRAIADAVHEAAQRAPKPEPKRRGRKPRAEEPPASDGADTADEPPSDDQVGDEAPGDAPTATEQEPQPVTCAECQETFPSVEAATEHYYATHGKPDAEPTA